MNEDDVLPLTEDDNVALIGFGATNLIAGHQHECSFGQLKGLSVSPYDAFVSDYSNYNVSAYTAQDIIGEPIPAEYLYQDEDATTNGVVRTGTDGYGEQNDGIDANIDFVTNSTTYKNAEDGTAFEYGTQGANYTWTTYLKAPESGDYTIKVEGIAATTIKGTITIENAETSELEEKGIAAAGGDTGVGTYGNRALYALTQVLTSLQPVRPAVAEDSQDSLAAEDSQGSLAAEDSQGSLAAVALILPPASSHSRLARFTR